jgi:ferritin
MAKKPLVDKSCTSKLEAAIKYELGHYYLYKHLSVVSQTLGYFGAQAYFEKESLEENGHAQKHIQFLNDMGVMAKLPTLTPESEVPKDLMGIIELALDNEADLFKYYNEIYASSMAENPAVAIHLQFFIDKQIEAVGFYGDLLATFESEKQNPNVSLVIDKKLEKLSK